MPVIPELRSQKLADPWGSERELQVLVRDLVFTEPAMIPQASLHPHLVCTLNEEP